jgi:beta-lactamase superfamily II metal-dependent hydrolase
MGKENVREKSTYNDSEIWIEMLPANEGDCILVTIPHEDVRILIDGGTSETYTSCLRERLLQIKEEGKGIDLLVVTHIDNDHIGGIIELLKENGSFAESKIIKIQNIWHNSYRHLQFHKGLETGEAEKQILQKIVARGVSQEMRQFSEGKKEVSALQGTSLAALILQGGYNWNLQFFGKAVKKQQEKIRLGDACTIEVLLPGQEELERLAKKWKYELKRSRISFQFSEDKIFDDAYEYYYRFFAQENTGEKKQVAARTKEYEDIYEIEKLAKRQGKPDYSETNASSISLLLDYKEKRILLLADNTAGKVMESGKISGMFDAIKLPHHGSVRNISDGFLANCVTEKYLISTSSEKYGHPDIETLSKIMVNRAEYPKQIYFNYEIEKVKEFEERVKWNKQLDIIYLAKGQKIVL